ncbi:hypothetical protein GQ457_07G010190 [Hibiscus cannabinus]
MLGEKVALNCNGIIVDAINQKYNAKTIKQHTHAVKRGVLKWLVAGRKGGCEMTKNEEMKNEHSAAKIMSEMLRLKIKDLVKNLDQDENEYAWTRK